MPASTPEPGEPELLPHIAPYRQRRLLPTPEWLAW